MYFPNVFCYPCAGLTCHCLVVSWWTWWLRWIRWRILCWIRCCRHSRLWLYWYRVISLIWYCWVTWRYSWLLGIRGMDHCGSSCGGHNSYKQTKAKILVFNWSKDIENFLNLLFLLLPKRRTPFFFFCIYGSSQVEAPVQSSGAIQKLWIHFCSSVIYGFWIRPYLNRRIGSTFLI